MAVAVTVKVDAASAVDFLDRCERVDGLIERSVEGSTEAASVAMDFEDRVCIRFTGVSRGGSSCLGCLPGVQFSFFELFILPQVLFAFLFQAICGYCHRDLLEKTRVRDRRLD